METLIINAGSSSVKFRLYTGRKVTLEGAVERIGKDARLVMKDVDRAFPVERHKEAGLVILSLLNRQPDMIVHRVVHGGMRARPVRLTAGVIDELYLLSELAPLHMPPALDLVRLFSERTAAKQVACFDTSFHRTMPPEASTYAIPPALAKKHGIQRYGFHGIAHAALCRQAAGKLRKRRPSLVTCQLGNGASVCAIRDGKSVDTSMGFTPLEGLVMGTRSGSLDPAIVEFLCRQERMSVEQVLHVLEKESGLLGMAGRSDVRDLLGRKDRAARFALDLFSYRVKHYIGAYALLLGKPDAIVLGGGVVRSERMRGLLLSGLEPLGVRPKKDLSGASLSAGLPVYAFEVDEQDEMFRMTKGFRLRSPR